MELTHFFQVVGIESGQNYYLLSEYDQFVRMAARYINEKDKWIMFKKKSYLNSVVYNENTCENGLTCICWFKINDVKQLFKF